MVMYCPYCDMEINEKQMENEDGCCPECGAFISPGMAIMEDEDDDYDEYASAFEDEEDEDDEDEDDELDEEEEDN